MAYMNIYTGAALATYEKIQTGIDEIIINKVYKSKTAKALFYINNKGYLHILTAGTTKLNNKIIGYHLTDNILTIDNELKYKGSYTKEYQTIEQLKEKIIDLIA